MADVNSRLHVTSILCASPVPRPQVMRMLLPCFPDREENSDKNNKAFYHSFTRDWLSNEIFRRVDKKGRTQGEFLKEMSMKYGFDNHPLKINR